MTFLYSLRIVVDIFLVLLPWIFEKHAYSLSHWQFDNSLIPQYGKYESRASRWWAYSLLYPRGVSAAFQLSYKNPRCVSVMLLCNQYSCLNREHNTFCLNCISRNASFFFFFFLRPEPICFFRLSGCLSIRYVKNAFRQFHQIQQ